MSRADWKKLNVREILSRYGERAAQAARGALAENARTLTEEAKRRCPVESGRLRDSIRVEMAKSGNKAKLVADAKNEAGIPYARIVEFSPKIDRPFMYPAMDAKYEEMKRHMIDRIREAIHQ